MEGYQDNPLHLIGKDIPVLLEMPEIAYANREYVKRRTEDQHVSKSK